MNFKLIEHIEIKTEIPLDEVISIVKIGLNNKFQYFPDKIMNGHLKNDTLKAVVNSKFGWIDILKSSVRGKINGNEYSSKIELKIYPNAILISFGICWSLLIVLTIIEFDYLQIFNTLKFISLNLLYGFVPYLIAKLKVSMDRKRLENWLKLNLKKTVPNNV